MNRTDTHLVLILELSVNVRLFLAQVTVGAGRPFIRQDSLSSEPRVTVVVTGGTSSCGLPTDTQKGAYNYGASAAIWDHSSRSVACDPTQVKALCRP